jgi:hypothetical protein
MAPAIDKIGIKQVILLPAIFAALSFAILVSSEILSGVKVIPTATLVGILLFSIIFAISAVVLGLAAYALSKVGIDKIIEGGISIVILAAVIMVSSLILSVGKYEEGGYPSWKWALGVTTAVVGFGLAAALLGSIAMSGVGAVAMLAGAAVIIVIAAVIVATSKILAMGNYSKYPGLSWALGVGLTMTGFGTAMLALGTIILGSFGLGMAALVAGGEAVLLIAETIVKSAEILNKGNFSGGPTIAWASGIALALGAFAPVYAMLAANKIMSLFGGGVGPEDFANAIRTVSQGIVDAANYFSGAKVAFKGGPTKAWAEGVGTAIAAFAPVYAALSSGGFFSVKVEPKDMVDGILTISDGIIAAAGKFATNIAVFDITKVPSKTWGENVGAALQAFAPVFAYMNENSGWFTSGEEAVNQMIYGIKGITNTIITVAYRFGKTNPAMWKLYPPTNWIKGVSSAVKGFSNLVTNISGISLADTRTFYMVVSSLISTARRLYVARNYFKPIDPDYMKNLTFNLTDYMKLANSLTDMNKGSKGVLSVFGMDPVSRAANGMIKIAGAYDKLATALTKFGGSLGSIDENKVNLIRRLTGNLAVLSAMNSTSFSQMMKTLETKSSVFSKLVDVDKEKVEMSSVGDKKTNIKTDGKVGKPKKTEMEKQMDQILFLLSQISTATSTTAENTDKDTKVSDVKAE